MTAIEPAAPRVLRPLPEWQAVRLLSTVSFGRVVFTDRALPAIRPVNHIVCEGDIVIRSHVGSALLRAAEKGVVVAYEADSIDPEHHVGWSVVVTGMARTVSDAQEAARLERLLITWIQMPDESPVVRIHPDFITGFELIAP